MNDLEGIANADGGGGGLSPRLEAELIAMLSRPSYQAPPAADRATIAAMGSVVGVLVGVLGLSAVLWINGLIAQLRDQSAKIDELRAGLRDNNDTQRLALDALLRRADAGPAASGGLLDSYKKALKDLEETRAKAESFGSLAAKLEHEVKVLAAEGKALDAKLTRAEDRAKENESEAKLAKELRGELEQSKEQIARQLVTIATKSEQLEATGDPLKAAALISARPAGGPTWPSPAGSWRSSWASAWPRSGPTPTRSRPRTRRPRPRPARRPTSSPDLTRPKASRRPAMTSAPDRPWAKSRTSDPGYDPSELKSRSPCPEASPLAMDYYRSGVVVWFVVRAWGPARTGRAPLLGIVGEAPRPRQEWRIIPRREADDGTRLRGHGLAWAATIAVYAVLFLAMTYLIDLPLDYYLGYVRPHRYGLSNQTLGRWFEEGLKGLAVTAVVAALFLWVPFLLLARSPRRWWLWTGLLTLPFAVAGTIVKPIWIDPLFHEFGPMKDKALEAKILALAGRAGIEGGRVFEVDMSRDTKTVNAYVTGLFGSKRIVLWDTLLARLDERETLAVMGHEMGHYVLNHVAWGVSLATLGSLALLFLVDRSGRGLVRRFRDRFGFDRLADVAAVPLMLLLLNVFNLAGAPVQLAVSRVMEHEADRFGLEITRTNRSAATSFVKLQHENLSNPRPGWLFVLWRASHPPIGDRIDFCNAYHPLDRGPPRALRRALAVTRRGRPGNCERLAVARQRC